LLLSIALAVHVEQGIPRESQEQRRKDLSLSWLKEKYAYADTDGLVLQAKAHSITWALDAIADCEPSILPTVG
jgi:hypothetical protein